MASLTTALFLPLLLVVVLICYFATPATTRRSTATSVCFVGRHDHPPSSRIACLERQCATRNKLGLYATTSSSSCEEEEADFPGGISSSFRGAGFRRLALAPEEIPPLLMTALQKNDVPDVNSGLSAMWEFAAGNTQYIFDYNRTDFICSAHKTAQEFPTSFYGCAMLGQSWEMETPLNRVGGPDGWIATQVMKTISSDGRMRRWQWELRKNRRPPGRGIWLVETIGSSDRNGNFEPEKD